MALAELREAFFLLKKIPALWVPGIAGGLLAAAIWVSLNLSGSFFASRLLVISALVFHVFTTGILVITRNREGDLRSMLSGGIRYYFRVLLPQLVILFGVMLIVTVILIAFGLIGGSSDQGIITALAIGFMIPAVILTFFYDTAAVFEERKVFDSLWRSAQLVMAGINNVIAFIFISVSIILGTTFLLMIVWEIILFDRLEPVTRYNESQLQAFTPDQFMALIGPEGMWITAIFFFTGMFLLVPVLYTYKGCFFRKLSTRDFITQEPATGEYDSKGRWYKY